MEVIIIVGMLFFNSNADFFEAEKQQLAEGYVWKNLPECREVNASLPSLVIEPGNGKSLVCYKLSKWGQKWIQTHTI